MDKAIMDMATRSSDPAIRELLVKLLNEANDEVKAAHESSEGNAMKKDWKDENNVGKEAEELVEGVAPGDTSRDAEIAASLQQELRRSGRVQKPATSIWNQPEYRETFLEGILVESSEEEDDATSSDETAHEPDSDYRSDHYSSQPTSDDSTASESSSDDEDNPAGTGEWFQDPDGDIRLMSSTTKAIRESYSKMLQTEQEEFDQDTIYLRHLLTLKVDRVYTDQDLDDRDIMDRSLRLLYRKRFGQQHEYTRISPHIKYDKLSRSVVKSINKNNELTGEEIRRLQLVADLRKQSARYVLGRSICLLDTDESVQDHSCQEEAKGAKGRHQKAIGF